MTDFARTDEQRMLADMLAGVLTDAPDWAAAIEATGVDAFGVAEAEGGAGTDLRDAAVVAAALGRANAGLPWAEHWVSKRFAAADAQADDARALLHCAEIVGLCRTMLRDTAVFLRERRQFGVAIATFQSLRHRMADMAMALELAEAMTDRAIAAFEGDPAERAQAVSAARVLAEEAGRIVGEGAVQLHGAMGLTAELRVGGYFRRARMLMQRDGTARAHLRRYAA